MRSLSVSIAVAALPALLAINPAAAQTFDDRWSIIPKAHAEPIPQAPDNSVLAPRESGPAPGSEEHPAPETPKHRFSGKASFYSYRKAKTASGASFDRDQFTAAHRSLPLGTRVRVTDLATNRSVVVRITDRGPFVRNRVLDLSLGTARFLGIEERGVIEIRAEVLS
jgi:rare lipoprotein A